jgi:hypothetical protein
MGHHNTLDRFSLTNPQGIPISTGVSVALELDLNVLTEELIDRLDDDDLIAFLVGIVEAVDDVDTTEHLWNKMREILQAQERAALAEEADDSSG